MVDVDVFMFIGSLSHLTAGSVPAGPAVLVFSPAVYPGLKTLLWFQSEHLRNGQYARVTGLREFGTADQLR